MPNLSKSVQPRIARIKVNYFYFGFLFVFLTLLHVVHILLIDHGSLSTKFFFVIYSITQCFLQIMGLILIGGVISAYLPRFFTSLFIVCTFLLFLAQVVDFPLIRIMDMSIWYVLDFLPQESPKNFIEMLYASNISISAWITGGVVGLIFLVFGVGFFQFTQRKVSEKPLLLTYSAGATTVCMGFICLFLWDIWGINYASIQKDGSHEKALPWKATFFYPKLNSLVLNAPLKQVHEGLLTSALPLENKPPIFLFVVESLREDFITPEIAPNLYRFKKDNISFDLALSNANATQLSWFSIFHSKLPFYWSTDAKGAPPLKVLKDLGYKINLYTSSCLRYYEMDKVIFGEEKQFLDSGHYFSHDDETPIHKSDTDNIKELCKTIRKSKSIDGNVFVVFLESTHFSYDWPRDKATLFKPCSDGINYLKAALSHEDLGKIKNSYRNAIHHIDSLFGKVDKRIPKEAIVIFTGDHGEEFYDQGYLFHASNLSKAQTHVPLYYKIGKNPPAVATDMTSHIDIFPTILHHIQGKKFKPDLYHGSSIFMKRSFPFLVSARYNASRTPYEFFIHNGKYKMTARFSDEHQIFKSKELKILSLLDDKDERIIYSPQIINEEFNDALHHLFSNH